MAQQLIQHQPNSDEAGTITSNLSFSTSNSAGNGPNSITFNTLGNATYSSQWVKVTDAVGNISNTLYIPSFTVAANPYGTTDPRYYMWVQNHSNFSGSTRGTKGIFMDSNTARHDSRTLKQQKILLLIKITFYIMKRDLPVIFQV